MAERQSLEEYITQAEQAGGICERTIRPRHETGALQYDGVFGCSVTIRTSI